MLRKIVIYEVQVTFRVIVITGLIESLRVQMVIELIFLMECKLYIPDVNTTDYQHVYYCEYSPCDINMGNMFSLKM
jgi:hypothetical protein